MAHMAHKKITLVAGVSFLLGFLSLAEEQPEQQVNRFEIDSGAFMVAGPTRRITICRSEIERPGVDGKENSVDALISYELAYQECQRMKVPIEGAAQKHIQGLKKEHGLTDAQVDMIFQQAGRTLQEGMQELERVYAYNSLMDMKVASRIAVLKEDVEKYYNENPKYDDPEYQVQIAFIPSDPAMSTAEQKKSIIKQCKEGKAARLPWREPFWIRQRDISEERNFITTLKPGQVTDPLEVPGGFEVIRVTAIKEKSLIPLERRYKKIMIKLRKPQYEKLCQEFNSRLQENAHVVALD
jgi:hypothetical protein